MTTPAGIAARWACARSRSAIANRGGDPAIPRIGLIAEEVADVFPAAVVRDPAGRSEGIDYRILTREAAAAGADQAAGLVRTAVARLAERL